MIRFLNRLEEDIIALLLVSMTVLVFMETLLRFGFNTGLLWAQELTLLMAAWLVLFGISYGLKKGAHIGVDFVVKRLPTNTARVVTGIMLLAALGYCGLMVYGSWVYLAKMAQIGIELEDMPVEKWKAQSILLIGFVLFGVRLIEILIRVIKGEQSTLLMHDEADEAKRLSEELANEKSSLLMQDEAEQEKNLSEELAGENK